MLFFVLTGSVMVGGSPLTILSYISETTNCIADFVSLAVILAVIIVHLQTMSIVQWAVLLLVQELEC